MYKQKIVKGLTIDYNGKTIDNILNVYIDSFEKTQVSFSYYENGNENVRINVNCGLKDVKININ